MAIQRSDLVATILERTKARGVTQQEVAQALGMTQGHLSKILAGKCPVTRRAETRMKDYLETIGVGASSVGPIEPAEARTLSFKIMQNMHSALTDLQRLCDGISHWTGKGR